MISDMQTKINGKFLFRIEKKAVEIERHQQQKSDCEKKIHFHSFSNDFFKKENSVTKRTRRKSIEFQIKEQKKTLKIVQRN